MERIKLRQVKVGTIIGQRICTDAERYYSAPESSAYLYNDRKIVKGEYHKCGSCGYRHRKQCTKIACLYAERSDGKTIIMEKI